MKLIDLTGKRFGMLTVIEKAGSDEHCNTKWRCKCDCGTVLDVYSINLRRGHTRSCGCIRSIEDITGKKFGRLTVLEKAEYRGRKAMWKCKCDCGTIKDVPHECLISGQSKSCGCLRKENNLNAYKRADLTGVKIGDVTVLEIDHIDNYRNTYWRCRRDNGDIFVRSRQSINRMRKKVESV